VQPRRTVESGMGSSAHGHRARLGRPWPVPHSQNKEKLAMSYDPQHQQGPASGPPVDQGPRGAARAANLLVGITMVVLLIALAVVVMLA
jgi:hypothetical protein